MRFTPMEEHSACVGVDLGQSKDPTSIAVVERVREVVPAYIVHDLRLTASGRDVLADMRKTLKRPRFKLRFLEQAPLGESYPAQAQRVNRILAHPSIAEHEPRVMVDYTGVGRAVYEIFQQARVPRMTPVTITFNGKAGPNSQGGHSVPKLDLIAPLQALMHTGCLFMPDSLPWAKTLRRELLDFRVSYTAVGNVTFGAREGAHDDLVLALALAVYGLANERVATVEPLRI